MRAVSSTLSIPGAVTRAIGAAPSLSAWLTEWQTIGNPATLCITFGRDDFMRVPLPAARMRAVTEAVAFCFFMAAMLLCYGPIVKGDGHVGGGFSDSFR